MSQTTVDLIFDLTSGKISEQEFFEKSGVERDHLSEEIAKLISLAHRTHDGDIVEASLAMGFIFGFPERFIDEVHRLIPLQWHTRHEDLIGLLQDWRSPDSLPTLVLAIDQKPLLKYLEYDDYGAYYKKCLWALAAIGTAEAKSVIRKYTDSTLPELRKEAVSRLSSFDLDAKWSKDRSA